MNNRINYIKRIDYRHFLCVLLILFMILFTIFVTPYTFERLLISFVDLKNSFVFYIQELFEIDLSDAVTVIGPPIIVGPVVPVLPDEFNIFGIKFKNFFPLLFNFQNFSFYWSYSINVLTNLTRFLLFFIIFVPIIYLIWNHYYKPNKKDYNKKSLALVVYDNSCKYFYDPIKNWFKNMYIFIKNHKYYFYIFFFIVFQACNLLSVIVSFVAWYFYFAISLDFGSIYVQLQRLLTDLSPLLKLYFLPLWILLFVFIFLKLTKAFALKRLNAMERYNENFINDLGNTNAIVGTTRKGKTTCLVDMAISKSIMMRKDAYSILEEISNKFFHFPFINFEIELKNAVANHNVYNLVTAKKYVLQCKKAFEANPNLNSIFQYDYNRFGLINYDGLKEENIWDALIDYAKAYFVYCSPTSLIFGNLSIRSTDFIIDKGNFPLWKSELFSLDKDLDINFSHNSHILDLDMVRMTRTLIKNNPNRYSLDFGIIVISEAGKERPNMVETKELKKSSEETNAKNDGMNLYMKMHGHSSNIRNRCFTFFIMDEQRPESIGADVRGLCSNILNISDKSENKLTYPFFWLRPMICEFFINKFSPLYLKFRFNRQDKTLFITIIKNIIGQASCYLNKISNNYGYRKYILEAQSGRMEGETTLHKYFIMNKKIYSNRFATDCFARYFEKRQRTSNVGINDLNSYLDTRANFNELKKTNSYFINELLKNDEDVCSNVSSSCQNNNSVKKSDFGSKAIAEPNQISDFFDYGKGGKKE